MITHPDLSPTAPRVAVACGVLSLASAAAAIAALYIHARAAIAANLQDYP